MKKIYKSFVVMTCLVLAFVAVALVGCNKTKVESITLTAVTINVGEEKTLTATIKPDDAKDVKLTWSSDDTSKVTVDSNGKVKGIAAGSATITAEADGVKGTCKVTVTEKSSATALTADMITLSGSSFTFNGKEQKPTVTVKANGKDVDSKEYTVTYADNTNAGTAAKVTVTAKSGSTVISGNASKTFTIAQAEVTKDSFTVTIDPVEKSDKSAQAPVVKFKNGTQESDYYTLKDGEYTVKYYVDATNGTELTGNVFTRQKKVVAKIAIVKDRNFKFTGDSLALDDQKYTITSPANTTFFTPTSGEVTLGTNQKFQNETASGKALAITKDTTQTTNDVTVFKITGTASKFKDATQITAFSNVDAISADRDDYIVLDLDNAEKVFDIEIGWIGSLEEDLADGTNNTTKTPGYKKFKDNQLILCVTGPNRTNYFCAKMDGKKYVLDLSELKTRSFFTAASAAKMGSNNVAFANASGFAVNGLGNVFAATGNAQAFSDAQATAFDNKTGVNTHHSYVALTLAISDTETWYGGWVAAPGDPLVKGDNGNSASKGYKEHTSNGRNGDHDLVLWVTRPDASDLRFFAVKVTSNGKERQYVLDITDLKTGSNIFSSETNEVDKDGKTVSTTGQGFKNKTPLTFKEEGNIIKVIGNSTKFTTNNKDKFNADGSDSNSYTVNDEYIVIHLGLDGNGFSGVTEYKCGWVSDPDKALESSLPAHTFVTGSNGSQTKDLTLTMCVTKRAGRTGWFYRIEIDGKDNKTDTRAYVLDLSELKKEGGQSYVKNFFNVKTEEATLGSQKKFKNDTSSNFKIEKVEGTRNVWKATGKATKFTSDNKAAFNSTVTESDAYIVMTFDNEASASVKMGWVAKVGDTITETQDVTKNGYKNITVTPERETFIIWTTRTNKTGNFFWVEISGVNYYLDCTNLGV